MAGFQNDCLFCGFVSSCDQLLFIGLMDRGRGFEPRFSESESKVLPLDDPRMVIKRWLKLKEYIVILFINFPNRKGESAVADNDLK